MAIFMKYAAQKTGNINGNATSAKHMNWIELVSVEFGYHRPMDGNVTTGKPVLSEVRVSKRLDASSPLLAQAGITGDVAKVTLEYVKDGKNAQETIMKVELTGAILARYDHLAFNDDSTVEKLALSYSKLEYTWIKGGIVTTFDVQSNT